MKSRTLLPPFQNKSYVWTQTALRNKSYIWWNFSQTSRNKLECCRKQCKGCCLWTTKSNNSLHFFNNWCLDSTASTHINAHFGAIRCHPPKMAGFQCDWRQKFTTLLWTALARRKALSESYATHTKRFVLKVWNMTLSPRISWNVNFCFETEGVLNCVCNCNGSRDLCGEMMHTSNA